MIIGMQNKQIYSVEVSKLSFNNLVVYFFYKIETAKRFAINTSKIGFPAVVKKYYGEKPNYIYEG
jgi:hypothetical protein